MDQILHQALECLAEIGSAVLSLHDRLDLASVEMQTYSTFESHVDVDCNEYLRNKYFFKHTFIDSVAVDPCCSEVGRLEDLTKGSQIPQKGRLLSRLRWLVVSDRFGQH